MGVGVLKYSACRANSGLAFYVSVSLHYLQVKYSLNMLTEHGDFMHKLTAIEYWR
jgi:hypothetical protein